MPDDAPKPRNHWNDKANVQDELDKLKKKNNWHVPEELYKLTKDDIISAGGRKILKSKYNGNRTEFIKSLHPEYEWKFYKFTRAPPGEWEKKDNQKIYFQDLCEKNDWLRKDGEYNKEKIYQEYNKEKINDFYGGTILRIGQYGSILQFLEEMSGIEWDATKFKTVPQDYWGDRENRKEFLISFARVIKIKTTNDWYKITTKMLQNHPKGKTILFNHYKGSPSKLVDDFVSPPDGWKLYRFGDGAPKGHWKNIANHKEFFDDYYDTYCKNDDDLYDVNQVIIEKLGGESLLVDYYNNSPSKFVMEMREDIQWKGYKFSPAPKNYWLDENNRKEWFDDFCNNRGFPDQDSLYSVTEKSIKGFHGISLLNGYYNASPAKLVVEISGYSNWKAEGFAKGMKKTELALFKCLKREYPRVEYQKMFDLKFDSSGIRIGVDMWIPKLNLAIEGQGEQHYGLSYFHRCKLHKKVDDKCDECLEKCHNQLKRDKEKREKILDLGHKFLVVPFCDKDELPKWISGDWESLKEIAKRQGIDI